MNIATTVQRQWFERSEDEKFASPDDLHKFLVSRKTASKELPVRMSHVHFSPAEDGTDLLISDQKSGQIFSPTNWAFSQACATVDAHPSYLSKLPAKLAADCLNHGFMSSARVKDRDLAFF